MKWRSKCFREKFGLYMTFAFLVFPWIIVLSVHLLYKENKKLKDVEQELFIRSEWYIHKRLWVWVMELLQQTKRHHHIN